ncbi:TonB-dependent receptor [Microbulbifer sp. TRSA001]|uniref:TonB-dependent receptor n=2 Tax=unclassified Microbulbifer TaxID=2619833 RepID=UPI0040391925
MKLTANLFALMTLSNLAHGISGQVLDSSGEPIYGASIEVAGSRQQAQTDAQGRFSLEVNTSQLREIHINAPGHSHKTVILQAGQDEPLKVTLQHTVIEQIDVTATPLHASTIESAQPVTVVAGEELRRKQASTLGETLKNEVGVHSSYFGPVASSPIIRGLNGPRVLITQNGLDSADASRVGPDHVVATETITAEQIEILRGPATLFYGSGAIGGVVNVVDERIPTSSENRTAYSLGSNTVADEREASLAHTGGNDQLAYHVDSFWRKSDDYEIPTSSDYGEESSGVLENSDSKSKGFNIGGNWFLDNGSIGLAYGRLERINGIPGHSHSHAEEHEEHEEDESEHHDEHEEELEVVSDLKQDRWQLASELSLDNPWLSGLDARIGYTDYEHSEIENNAIGTTFSNQTLQARVNLLLQEMAGWRGAITLESKTTDFEAIGEEAFTPPSTTESSAIGLIQEKHTGEFLWQLGARIERVTIEATDDDWEGGNLDKLAFTPYSFSAGLVWDIAANYNAGISFTHAQRAPSAAELFSYGPHIGTSTFEVGALFRLDDTEEPYFYYENNVEEEVSNNIDLSFRRHSGNIGWVLNLFYNQVDNFYYERNTGYTSEDIEEHDHDEEEESHDHGELPVYVFDQADSTLYGLEAEFAWQISKPLTLTLWGDTVRGKLDDGGNLPRTPPARLGGMLSYSSNGWDAGIEITHAFEQNKVSELETSTAAYTLLNTELAYTFQGSQHDLTVYLKANNLTDELAYVHSSFLKELAPLPGRNFSVGLRGMF